MKIELTSDTREESLFIYFTLISGIYKLGEGEIKFLVWLCQRPQPVMMNKENKIEVAFGIKHTYSYIETMIKNLKKKGIINTKKGRGLVSIMREIDPEGSDVIELRVSHDGEEVQGG